MTPATRPSIRPETPADFAEIHALVKTAFETAKVSNGDEQNFVDRLRAGPTYSAELALVAVEDGEIVGHVMLTTTAIDTATGPRPLLLLAPLAVVLARRSRGVGRALVEEVTARACALGHDAVVLVGDPAYYGRFGFRSSADFGVGNTNGIPDVHVQLLELVPGALEGVTGTLTF